MLIISEMLQQRSCQANVHGKHGQLKCFQKRQNKCKCHVRLEGADLLSLYNRNLKSLFIQVLTFENTDIYVSNQNFFIGPDLPKHVMLAKMTLFSEYDAAVKVLKSGSIWNFSYFFFIPGPAKHFLCLHYIYTCGMPRPTSTCECLNTYYWILDYNAKSLSWIMSM